MPGAPHSTSPHPPTPSLGLAGIPTGCAASFTVTSAADTGDLFTKAVHGLGPNMPVTLASGGTFPGGFAASTIYYVVGSSLTANTFQLSATLGGAVKAVTADSTGTLTLTYNKCPKLAHGATADTMGNLLPTVNLGTGRTATAIAAGGYHTCAILDACATGSKVKCWGSNSDGQLGYQGSTATSSAKFETTPHASSYVDLGAGRSATALAAVSSEL